MANNEWIPVSERLPEVGQNVAVYQGGYVGEHKYDIAYLSAQELWIQYRGVYALQFVTHWWPLPDPPGEAVE